ncbi:hypothetical protein PVAND_000731 [Polypedilum vanderplanki]|uniref:DM domain-containing protein n=1 Tax=Polypedilum vanderplanki TaxID=319348 RepID=A0A9J6BKU1_POLVA|nr:hypothetical protein PVAND_000731 [Polypedilum vanderplanki]
MSEQKNKSKNSLNINRATPFCARCRNHGLKLKLKTHKRYCRFRNCSCEKCNLTMQRQKIMAHQTAMRRAMLQDELRNHNYNQNFSNSNFNDSLVTSSSTTSYNHHHSQLINPQGHQNSSNYNCDDIMESVISVEQHLGYDSYESKAFIYAILKCAKNNVFETCQMIMNGKFATNEFLKNQNILKIEETEGSESNRIVNYSSHMNDHHHNNLTTQTFNDSIYNW